jgi:hypothetical protein
MKCAIEARRERVAQSRQLAFAVVALLVLSHAPTACAELGGTPTLASATPQVSSAVAARAREIARATSAPQSAGQGATPAWNVRETTLADSTVEREYVGSDGTVFAVAWRGPRRPALSALLGAGYATQMAQAARVLRQEGQGSHGVTSQAGGTFAARAVVRQRYSAGVAWLPQKLPAGVSPDALGIASRT